MNGRSIMHGHELNVVFPLEEADTIPNIKIPEHEALALDLANLADIYDDEEPTVKVQVPTFHNQVVVEETRYPGVGLIMALTLGVAMWFLPCYYFLMWVIFR